MPELPEVEVTRQGIDKPLRGAQITAIRLGKPLRWPLGCATETLLGAKLGPVTRRGKYLWLELLDGAGGLLMHLGMSGSLALRTQVVVAGPHVHFEMVTTQGTLRLTDPRRFGAVVWSPALDVNPARALLARLGHEPFDPALTAQVFHAALHLRRATIKAVLLGGEVMVGAGNIYACEALFEAGISPRLRCHKLSRPRAARLLLALQETLSRALALGGSSLRDFKDAHGMDGSFQLQARVYGRAGQPCVRCGGVVRRIVQAQRSTYYCPGCQRT